jgi:chaperone required for assembly of F1-ATPase
MSQRRRFYKTVEVTAELSIALDGRPVKTPGKALLALPTEALARAVADEWAAQGEKIKPSTMPLTKLANTAIDRVGPEVPRIAAEMVEYAGSDLVCYRAGRPPDLVARQAALWNPIVDWALGELDAPFRIAIGIMHLPQPPEALGAMEAAFAATGKFGLAGLHNIMSLTGSALIALMFARGSLSAEAAWAAAHADEDYQIAQWGQDEEAAERRRRRHSEFIAWCRFVELCRDE